MANPDPSLHGALNLLRAVERDRLVHLKDKLGSLNPGSQESKLLHAMVLLVLGQNTEARTSLESLKADTVAQLIACQWIGVDSTEGPEEPPDLSWSVARLYHLLAEENLCPASTRDMAYQVALHDLASQGNHLLGQLQKEARDRCSSDIMGDHCGFQPLHSDQGCLPPSSASPSVTRSQPRPIDTSDWSQGHSLHSTSSIASLASHLEISQSPTMPFLCPHRGTHGPSKLCDTPPASPEPQLVPAGCQEPEEVSWPLSVDTSVPVPLGSLHRTGVPEVSPEVASAIHPDSLAAPDTSVHCPVECTEASVGSQSLLPPTTEGIGKQPSITDQMSPPGSVGDDSLQNTTSSPAAQLQSPQFSTTLPPPPLPSASFPSSCPVPPASMPPILDHLETSEQKFYNFVVIHARADEHVALRIREKLETLGVPDGATFCEEFQVPGRGELHCLQDAIDHSGYTILLLTTNFDCRLSLHQVNHALMNSLTKSGRQDCVIPLLPLECSQAQLSPNTTSLLHSLVWLDEHSPIFARKVANTFKSQKLQAYRIRWKKEQETRALKEQSTQLEAERQRVAAMSAAYSTYVHSYSAWQAQMDSLQMAFGKDLSLGAPTPFPSWLGCPQLTPSQLWQGGTPVSPYFPQPPVSFPQQPPSFPQPPVSFPQQPPSFPQQPPSFPQQPPSFSQPPVSSPQSPPFPSASPAATQTPGPLIIHHAQMVQLGVNNHMWGQTGTQSTNDKTECEDPCLGPPSDQGGPLLESDRVGAHLDS
ncbi:TIR domain-containing adapter molecule 1 [Cricetulus griseus]|uniref:TIR domain-containing adapter molecule 1 n=1 Tax=Cricetulus griseus TaxID=10029 RepID=A0A3L7HL12_CRIGR|nr:TIR domain-containing adapter molecule 1 [Cricetulus griseus]